MLTLPYRAVCGGDKCGTDSSKRMVNAVLETVEETPSSPVGVKNLWEESQVLSSSFWDKSELSPVQSVCLNCVSVKLQLLTHSTDREISAQR